MRLDTAEVEADPAGLEAARNRQATYRLLAALFLYPSQDRLRELRLIARELTNGREAWPEISFPPEVWRLLERLQFLSGARIEEEYTTLFSVNPKAPPYESFYVDPEGFSRGWVGVNLDGAYAAAGVGVSSAYKEPSDHVTVELEFMAYLCSLEVQAFAEQNRPAWSRAGRNQAGFLNQHLGLWFAAFARKVRAASLGSFYDAVAGAADSFIAQELGRLRAANLPINQRIPGNGRAELKVGTSATSGKSRREGPILIAGTLT